MNEKTKFALGIVAAALPLGALADGLLRAAPWGVNFAVWMAVFVAALALLARWRPAALAGSGRWFFLPLLVFSAAFAWRDSPALKMLNLLGLLVTLSLVVLRAQGGLVRKAGLAEYALGSVIAALNAALGMLPVLSSDLEWKEIFSGGWSKRPVAIGRGLLLAVPLLLLFGGLFVAADAVFEGIVREALHLNFPEIISHFFFAAFCAWAVAGFLRGTLLGREREFALARRFEFPALGVVEMAIVLGSLDALFLGFVVVQLRYFFGGAELVQMTTGLTYAEYARRGFFELVAVAALVLPLLLAMHWLLKKDDPAGERIFRGLAAAQIAMLFVIMASAFERMRLYQAEYGLTEERLYPTAFMAWLAGVFVWFALTVLRGRRKHFAFGALVAGYLLIGALQLLNPDSLIARANIARALAGKSFDARYAGHLSADAAPVLAKSLPALGPGVVSPSDRCALAARIIRRWSPAEGAGWRTSSLGRGRAIEAVRENAAALTALACSENKE